MEKTLKFFGILFLLVFLSGCAKKEVSCNCPVCPVAKPEKSAKQQVVEVIRWYKNSADTRDWEFYEVSGNSMVEYGFNSGDYVIVNREDCQEGDFCVFHCLSEKCRNETMIKKLIKVSDEGYWFQGNEHKGTCPAGMAVNGSNCDSFDSRDYGWLKKDIDFNFMGKTTLDSEASLK